MTIPRAETRTRSVTSATRENGYGVAATAERRMLVSGPAAYPVATDIATGAGLTAERTAAPIGATWHEARWRWNLVRPDDVCWALAFALGPPDSASDDGMAYCHEFRPGAETLLPSFTAEELVAPGWCDRYAGGIVRRISLSGGSMARGGMTLSADLLFAGRTTGTGGGTTVAGEPVWRFGTTRLWIGTGWDGTWSASAPDIAGARELTARLLGFAATIDNEIDPATLIDPAGGAPMRPERGVRRYEFALAFEIADRGLFDAVADDARAIEIGWRSGLVAGATERDYGARIVWPRVSLASARPADGHGGRVVAEFAWRILDDPARGPFAAIAWNRAPVYAGGT